ncbi:MAG: activator of Hsp90 ATPase [Thermoleophilia bacterium]|nr:activator of Hsp90 ATPase [Thermoleophilia bacterium]
MSDTKTQVRHTFDRMIPADIEDVWRALTDPDELQQCNYEQVVESSWMPGEPVRYLGADGEVMSSGVVTDVDAPHRLVHTFALTAAANASAAKDAPSRVTWTMEPDDEGTRVTLVHDGFTGRTETWRHVEDGWDGVLDGLVGLFDDGGE